MSGLEMIDLLAKQAGMHSIPFFCKWNDELQKEVEWFQSNQESIEETLNGVHGFTQAMFMMSRIEKLQENAELAVKVGAELGYPMLEDIGQHIPSWLRPL